MSYTVLFPSREFSDTHREIRRRLVCGCSISGNSCLLHKHCCIKFHLWSFNCPLLDRKIQRNTQMYWLLKANTFKIHKSAHIHRSTHLLVSSGILIFSSAPRTVFLFFLSFHWSHLSTICSSIQQGLRPGPGTEGQRVCVCQWTMTQPDNPPPPHTHTHTSNTETLHRDQSVGIFHDGC